MRPNILTTTLALCATLAVAPLLGWAGVETFGSAGPGWLGALTVTVPVGLGLAAVILAIHGLLLHQALVDAVEGDFAGSVPPSDAPAFATVGAATAPGSPAPTAELPAVAAAPTAGGRSNDLAGKAGEKVRTAGKQAGGRVVRRTKSKAKNSVKREVRGALRDLRPKF